MRNKNSLEPFSLFTVLKGFSEYTDSKFIFVVVIFNPIFSVALIEIQYFLTISR